MSLRVRFGLSMAVLALALGILAGAYVYQSTVATLGHALDRGLRSSSRLVAAELARSTISLGVPGRPRYSHDQAFVQVFDGAGALLYASATARPDVARTRARARQAGPGLVTFDLRRAVDGTSYLAGAIRVSRPAGPARIVVVASSLDQLDDSANHLRQILLGGIPAFAAIAFLAGVILADRALRPVERLRAGAAALRTSPHAGRLPVPAGRDEISALARTLNGFLDDVDSLLRRQRIFVASASHELRTPLALASADLELALAPGADPGDTRRRVERAVLAIQGLGKLCDGLLELASAEDDALRVETRPTELGPYLLSILDRFTHTAAEREVDIVFDVDDRLVVQIDPPHLALAIHNVVDNALRFAPPGSALLVSARRHGDAVEIAVADDGPGFPDAILADALQPFARGQARSDAGSTAGPGHYGLGLAIALAAVAAHQGTLEVANAEQGAVVRLRVAAAPESGRDPERAQAGGNATGPSAGYRS